MTEAALDTSHGASLAVLREGCVVFEASLPVRGREADRDLVPWLRAGLAAAGVDARDVERWTVGTGPGSFSGLRAGIAIVKGICTAAGTPYRGIPSSVALALEASAGRGGPLWLGVLHDARCGQVIVTRFLWTGARLEAPLEASVEEPGELETERLRCDLLVTAQAETVLPMVPAPLRPRILAVATPAARWLALAPGWGWPGDAAAMERSAEPVYVRPPVFVAPQLPGARP